MPLFLSHLASTIKSISFVCQWRSRRFSWRENALWLVMPRDFTSKAPILPKSCQGYWGLSPDPPSTSLESLLKVYSLALAHECCSLCCLEPPLYNSQRQARLHGRDAAHHWEENTMIWKDRHRWLCPCDLYSWLPFINILLSFIYLPPHVTHNCEFEVWVGRKIKHE